MKEFSRGSNGPRGGAPGRGGLPREAQRVPGPVGSRRPPGLGRSSEPGTSWDGGVGKFLGRRGVWGGGGEEGGGWGSPARAAHHDGPGSESGRPARGCVPEAEAA